VVVHGTQRRHWASIKAGGLQRMGRTHVHCAKGMPGQAGVISGMRAACDVFIHVDLARALADADADAGGGGGLAFFESENGVVLCADTIPPRYFKHVLDRSGVPFDPDFPTPLPSS
jgi:2'-phosphotransferase